MNVNLFCMSTTSKHLLHECTALFLKITYMNLYIHFSGEGASLETYSRFRLSSLEVRNARPTMGFRRGGCPIWVLALVIFYCSEFKLSLSIQLI